MTRTAWLRIALVAILLLPFALVFACGRWAAATLAPKVAVPLSAAAAKIAALSRPAPPPTALPPTPEAAAIAGLGDGLAESSQSAASGLGNDAASGAPAAAAKVAAATDQTALPRPSGVLVSRQRVRAAARAGIRPSGSPVGGNQWRAAGMALTGIELFGVGLRSGDVVTRVGGTPARSQGAVVAAVSAALRRRQPAIVAQVWRGRQKIIVTVQLPLPRAAAPQEKVPPKRRSRPEKVAKPNRDATPDGGVR